MIVITVFFPCYDKTRPVSISAAITDLWPSQGGWTAFQEPRAQGLRQAGTPMHVLQEREAVSCCASTVRSYEQRGKQGEARGVGFWGDQKGTNRGHDWTEHSRSDTVCVAWQGWGSSRNRRSRICYNLPTFQRPVRGPRQLLRDLQMTHVQNPRLKAR